MSEQVWTFVIQGGAMAILAVMIIVIAPKIMSERINVLEKLSSTWLESHKRDRARLKEVVRSINKATEALTKIATLLEGIAHPRKDA